MGASQATASASDGPAQPLAVGGAQAQPAVAPQPAAQAAPQPVVPAAIPVPVEPEAPVQPPGLSSKRSRAEMEAKGLGEREDAEAAWRAQQHKRESPYNLMELGLAVDRLEFLRRTEQPHLNTMW